MDEALAALVGVGALTPFTLRRKIPFLVAAQIATIACSAVAAAFFNPLWLLFATAPVTAALLLSFVVRRR
jgi:hypothetical protein